MGGRAVGTERWIPGPGAVPLVLEILGPQPAATLSSVAVEILKPSTSTCLAHLQDLPSLFSLPNVLSPLWA